MREEEIMTRQLTRERIEQYASDPRMCNIYDEIREMARMALVTMDSEPVFFIEIEGGKWINAGRIPGSTFDFNNLPDGVNNLYAAPQPAPVVPDEITIEQVAEITAARGSEYSIRNNCC